MEIYWWHIICCLILNNAMCIMSQSCNINPKIPSILTTTGKVLVFHNGTQNITIACYCKDRFNRRIERVRWFFNETRILLQKDTSSRGHPYVALDRNLATLIIPTFNGSFSGMYTCGNKINIDRITVYSSVHLLIPPILPVITTMVQNENYYEKEPASFHCEAAGVPIPEISWYFNNMKLKFDGKHIIFISRSSGHHIRGTLLILNTSSFDVGTYICEVTNTAGSVNSSGILTVYVAPTVVKISKIITVMERSSINITCEAEGFPAPNISIKTSEKKTDHETRRIKKLGPIDIPTGIGNITRVKYVLIITEVLRVDHGKYKCCVVSDKFGRTIEEDSFLDVQFAPEMLILPMNASIMVNSNINFTCTVVANPKPHNVTWKPHFSYSLDYEIYTSSINSTATSSTLTLGSVDHTYSGNYCCLAYSNNTIVKTIATLTVNVPCFTVLLAPLSQYVNLTHNAKFTCNATGYKVSYHWTIGKGSFPSKVTDLNSNTLVIPSVRSSDKNEYCCYYSNVECTKQRCANLTVGGQPKVRIYATPSNNISIESSFTLIANASGIGVENFTYEWIHNGVITLKTTNHIFNIMSVKEHDGGNYKCTVKNAYGDIAKSNSISLKVIISLPKIISHPRSQRVDLAQNATFKCNATGYGVHYQWIRKGFFPNKTVGIFSETLTIPDVRSSDDSEYTCIASNKEGKVVSKPAQLTVTGLPEVTVTPFNLTIEITHTATFVANVKGVGVENFTYTWTHKGKVLYNENSSILKIDYARKHNEGIYHCHVSNIYNDSDKSNEVQLNIRITPPPSPILWPRNKTITLINNVTSYTITCMTVGAIIYRWHKHPHRGIPENINFAGRLSNRLQLINLQPHYAGSYQCRVKNNSGSSYSHFSILIIKVAPPTFASMPQSQGINLKRNAVFMCMATGYNISYQWTIGSGSFPSKVIGINSNTLVIPDVRSSDDKTYTCVASNQGGSVSSNAAKLTVNGLPTVTIIPSNQTIEATFTAEFNTIVSGIGSRRFKYQWYHNETIINGEIRKNLVITNITESKGGKYKCVVINCCNNTAESESAILMISRNLPYFTIHPENKVVDLIDNVTNASLTCQAGGAESYDWEKQYNGNSFSIATNTNIFTLINLRPQDAGYYRCKATNGSGSNYSEFALLSIIVLHPIISESPKNVIVPLLSTATFKCIGQSFGFVRVVWEKRNTGSPLPSKTNVNTTYRLNDIISTLTIPTVQVEDEGVYQCAYVNSKGITYSYFARLDIGTPLPVITEHPNDKIIELHSVNSFNISICCNATGYDLSYSIAKEGLHLTADIQINNDGSFCFTIVNAEPADSGHYQCVVTNSAGFVSSRIANIFIFACGPKIVTHPADTSAGAPFSAVFTCSAIGYGNLSIKWKRNDSLGVPIKSFHTQVSSSANIITSTLIIPNVTDDDSDSYYCVGWIDMQASKSKSALLHYSGTPVKPTVHVSSPVYLNISNSTLTMKCIPEDNNSNYEWEKRNTEFPSRFKGANSPCLTILNLMLEDAGEYRCIISNSTGRIASDYTTLIVNGTVKPTVHVSSPVYLNISNFTLTMKCIPEDNNSNYEWEKRNTEFPSRFKGANSSCLTILNLIPEDAGEYRCIISNSTRRIASDYATLTINGVPAITYVSNSTTSFEYEVVKLVCKATNYFDTDILQIKFIWYDPNGMQIINQSKSTIYSGSRINQYKITTDNVIDGQVESMLQLNMVNHTDSGEYTCRVFNHHQFYVEAKISLIVEYSPIVTVTPGPPHTICNIQLVCTAEGLPDPDVQWYKLTVPIDFPAKKEKAIIISEDLANTYLTCVAKNYAGKKERITTKHIFINSTC